jgi:hypothetical protein
MSFIDAFPLGMLGDQQAFAMQMQMQAAGHTPTLPIQAQSAPGWAMAEKSFDETILLVEEEDAIETV